MQVRWIPGYEGLYSATDEGQIISYKYLEPRYLKLSKNNYGYLNVQLHKNNESKSFKVHRLICLTFLENPENKPEVNHKDGNKQNNRLENLEYCTRSENTQHAYNTGLNKAITGDKHYRYDATVYYFSHPVYGAVCCTQFELRNNFQLDQANLTALIKGRLKTTQGWHLV